MPALPIFKIQREALLAIAANRHPGNHIAGGIVINLDGRRFSKDIDIFHDLSGNENRVRLLKDSVDVDTASLNAAGFELVWDAVRPEFHRGIISKDGDRTVLEWVVDSDFRFFEAVQDETFGYRLDMFDLATNKVLAAASRKEARDVIDLLHINESYFPLAAAIWAAPAKDPGCTPESLIEDIKRNCIYRQDDFDRLLSEQTIDARVVSIAIKSALRQAEDFAASMPPGYDGMAFLEDHRPVQPDVSRLGSYQLVEAQRQSHWPSSPEIGSEMIDAYKKLDSE
jgi:hypothetical protein